MSTIVAVTSALALLDDQRSSAQVFRFTEVRP